MGAEASILPVRTYQTMFPHQLLPDGSPHPQHLQPTIIEFQCKKESILQTPECITLQIGLPGKKLISSQFFLSYKHDQILIGHPACSKLRVYTLNVDNMAPDFDQKKLLSPFCEIDNVTAEPRRFQDLSDLMTLYPDQFDVIGNFEGDYHIVTDPNVPPVQHSIRKTPTEYQEKIEK